MIVLSKLINIRNIIIAALVIVILYMIMCRGEVKKDIPQVEAPKEQIKDVVKDEVETKVNVDSLQAIQDKLIKQNSKTTNSLLNEQDKTLLLQQENDALRAKLAASDLTTDLNASAEKLKENARKKDSLCNRSIKNLSNQITLKSKIITEKDELYKKTRLNFDTAVANISSLQKYISKTKPRNQLYAGAMFIGNDAALISGFGVQAGMKFKNGTMVSIMAIQTGAITQFGVGIGKVISFIK